MSAQEYQYGPILMEVLLSTDLKSVMRHPCTDSLMRGTGKRCRGLYLFLFSWLAAIAGMACRCYRRKAPIPGQMATSPWPSLYIEAELQSHKLELWSSPRSLTHQRLSWIKNNVCGSEEDVYEPDWSFFVAVQGLFWARTDHGYCWELSFLPVRTTKSQTTYILHIRENLIEKGAIAPLFEASRLRIRKRGAWIYIIWITACCMGPWMKRWCWWSRQWTSFPKSHESHPVLCCVDLEGSEARAHGPWRILHETLVGWECLALVFHGCKAACYEMPSQLCEDSVPE